MEFSFWGKPQPRKPGGIYELRSYSLKVVCVHAGMQLLIFSVFSQALCYLGAMNGSAAVANVAMTRNVVSQAAGYKISK